MRWAAAVGREHLPHVRSLTGVTRRKTLVMQSTAAAATVACLLAGCASSTKVPEGSEGSAAYECTSQIRSHGVIYSGYGYTDQEATSLGTADEAVCHDVGQDAPGSVFPDDPHQVAVWTFAGYASDQVLGVRFGQDSFVIFIAESVPRHQADRIFSELSAE
jgi:Family of unknown function (DUF6281)